jgi:hypothetical protein
MENSGLDDERQRFVRESEERDKVVEELFEKTLTVREKVELFWNDVKEKVQIGKYVDRVETVGKVGGELSVFLSGNNLKDLLPEGVTFRGVKYDEEVAKELGDYVFSESGPFYNPITREVCVNVDVSIGSETRLMNEVKYSGLIFLHEIGHAKDDEKRPERLNRLEELGELRDVVRYVGGMEWFRQEHFETLKERSFDVGEVRTSVDGRVRLFLERQLEKDGKYSLRSRLKSRNVEMEDFVNKLQREVSDFFVGGYQEACDTSKFQFAEDAQTYIRDMVDKKEKSYRDEYFEEQSNMEATSERQVWAEALVMARELIKSGIKLWDKDLKDLLFFIDRLINAHGVSAGRKGVKNPKSREKLFLPKK